jgi:hypothetical protein
MAATLQAFFVFTGDMPGLPALILAAVAGAAQYAALLWLLDRDSVNALMALARDFLPTRKRSVARGQ